MEKNQQEGGQGGMRGQQLGDLKDKTGREKRLKTVKYELRRKEKLG